MLGIYILAGSVIVAIPIIFALRAMTKRHEVQRAALDEAGIGHHQSELLGLDKTYRAPFLLLPVSLFFFVAGAFALHNVLVQATRGEPMIVGTTLGTQSATGVASFRGRLFWCLFPFPFLMTGGYLTALWKNYRLTVSPDGVHATEWLDRRYDWQWGEITRAERRDTGSSVSYQIGDPNRLVRIDAGESHKEQDAMLKIRFALRLCRS